MKVLIKNGVVIIDGTKRIDNGAVLVEDDKIIGVYKDYQNIFCDEEIDASGQYILPGLIETHTHGAMGYDFNNCTNEELKYIEEASLKEGVTGFMASLTCDSYEIILKLLDQYEEANVSNLIGVHMEGPFINPLYKGVMKEEYIQKA